MTGCETVLFFAAVAAVFVAVGRATWLWISYKKEDS